MLTRNHLLRNGHGGGWLNSNRTDRQTICSWRRLHSVWTPKTIFINICSSVMFLSVVTWCVNFNQMPKANVRHQTKPFVQRFRFNATEGTKLHENQINCSRDWKLHSHVSKMEWKSKQDTACDWRKHTSKLSEEDSAATSLWLKMLAYLECVCDRYERIFRANAQHSTSSVCVCVCVIKTLSSFNRIFICWLEICRWK